MGLFSKKAESVVLFDIGSSSVGGAYLRIVEGQAPQLCYTARVPLELREGESVTETMIRGLHELCDLMIREGAAALHREAGHAHIDLVLASVSGPWQETEVRIVSLQEKRPFLFTRALMEKAVRAKEPSAGRMISDTSVISTTLNGYETEHPWGKRALRADLTVLTSTIDKFAAKEITKAIRKAFHSHKLELTAFAPVAYAVVSDMYPLQKDFVVLDVSGTATDAMLVKKGVIAGVRSLPQGIHDLLVASRGAARTISGSGAIDSTRNATFASRVAEVEAVWLSGLKKMLADFAAEHPLPRAVFLLADENARDFLKRLIDESTLRTLWLSDEPLSIIPLSPEHTASLVKARGLADGDIFLSMLALFYHERLAKR
ncbi:MAG: hypothetical protein KA104_02810 [Candidatus Pacebacteria bacterium]|nr:hypothetical protein [Candidatus Paceibacterota bacterium]